MAGEERIVVLGAGAVGCFVGGAWAAAGLPVVFIGRERIAADIAERGMSLSDHRGWAARLEPQQVAYEIGPEALARADVVLVAVKSRDTAGAARQVARHAPKGASVISLQNGIANAELLAGKLRDHEVVPAMVGFNVVELGPGRWHKGTTGDLVMGESAVTRNLAERMEAGPAAPHLSADMRGMLWGKLLLNLNNAVNALSGETLLAELKQRDYRRVLAAAMIETLNLLEAAGIEPAQIGPIPPGLLPHAIGAPDWIFRNMLLRVWTIDPQARSSMADDLAAGRPTEIDYLNGEVVRLARSLGRPAPVNAAIVELVKQAEAGVRLEWTARKLRAKLLEAHPAAKFLGY